MYIQAKYIHDFYIYIDFLAEERGLVTMGKKQNINTGLSKNILGKNKQETLLFGELRVRYGGLLDQSLL